MLKKELKFILLIILSVELYILNISNNNDLGEIKFSSKLDIDIYLESVSDIIGGYYKLGRLAIVEVKFIVLKGTTTTESLYITGLSAPLNKDATLLLAIDENTNIFYKAQMNIYGNLLIYGLPNGAIVRVSGMYIAK